jgi:RimJ/RimL family protein N-acetyltransferase
MGVNGTPARDYFLTTARLGFGHWSASDLALARGLWGNTEVTAWIGGPFTKEQIEQRLSQEIASLQANGVQYWPLFILQTNQHAGCAGLRPYQPDQRIYELGFHLRPECWGRGLAEEAGQALVRYAFEQMGASALFAGHHPGNRRSSRVLAKLGFQFVREEFYPPTGLQHPSYLLTHSDYSGKK